MVCGNIVDHVIFCLSSFHAKLTVGDKDTDLLCLLVLTGATFEERERFILEPQQKILAPRERLD